MLVDQLVGLGRGLGQNTVCLGTGLIENGILIADNLLVFLDLVGNPQAQFHQKLFQLFFIYKDLCIG